MTDAQIERWGEEFASTSDRQVWELLAEFRDEIRAEQRTETAELRTQLADLNNAITWETTCLNCSRLLTRSYEDYCRADALAAAVLTVANELTQSGSHDAAGQLGDALDRYQETAGERCTICGDPVEPLGMVLHFRAEHATAEDLAESTPLRTPATQASAPRCVCGDPIEWMDHPDDPGWIHSPGSDTPCLDARPAVAGPATRSEEQR